MRRLPLFLLLPGVAAAIAACESKRATTTAPVGPPAYGTVLALALQNLPGGLVRFPKPTQAPDTIADSLIFVIGGLDSLAGGAQYVIWVGDSTGADASFKRLTGDLTEFYTDTIINALGDPQGVPLATTFTNVSAFNLTVPPTAPTGVGGGSRTIFRFVTTRQKAGLLTDSLKILLISVEKDPAATAPSPTRRTFWARRSQGTDATTAGINGGRQVSNAAIRFGNFAPLTTDEYVYRPNGRGRLYFRQNVIVVNDSGLPRPPLGFYYATFALKRDSVNAPADTVALGAQHSPFPRRSISLRDADSVIVDNAIQVDEIPSNFAGSWPSAAPAGILAASTRASSDTVAALKDATGSFHGFAQVFVVLQSKDADDQRMGPSVLLRADIPGIVRSGH